MEQVRYGICELALSPWYNYVTHSGREVETPNCIDL